MLAQIKVPYSPMKRRWKLLSELKPKSVDEVVSILLANRGIRNTTEFLNPKHPREYDIEELGIDGDQLSLALDRIAAAKKNDETILIFGDYDADGICATAILWLTLHNLGNKVKPFIPHREEHGYGISNAAIDDILSQEKPDLIITVDNGIVAHEPVKRLMREEGIDVIVTDHHQPEMNDGKLHLPEALAVVHTSQLCGSGISWILSRELSSDFAETQLDLAGIATIADQVPLLGANRSFAKWGIEAVKDSKRMGLIQLLKAARVDRKKIDSNTVGFTIAPRINAMGRLKHGLDALRLMCTNNEERASKLVAELSKTNITRQDMTADFLLEAVEHAREQSEERIIISASSHYHEGVIGLIAGRLAEKYHKPAIAISLNGEVSKASARSVNGINIIEFLREIKDELLEVGGHPMAAGFSFESLKAEKIKSLLQQLARDVMNEEQLVPEIEIDVELPPELISEELVLTLDKLAPFGQGNLQPVFKISGLNILTVSTMGKENEHIKLVVTIPGSEQSESFARTLNILGWRKGSLAAELSAGETVSIVGSLELNHWNGRSDVQMVMRDMQILV